MIIRRLYNWVLGWANSPYGTLALFALAFAESSFFPIPPDILLIALCISKPKKSFFYVIVCSLGSILGGMFGYLIGARFMDLIGMPIVRFYKMEGGFNSLQTMFRANDLMIVWLAGFTPIPYKLCTITAGMVKISFPTFVFASFLSRTTRFLIQGIMIYIFGSKIRALIDKYFNSITLIFGILLVGGFIMIKFLLNP